MVRERPAISVATCRGKAVTGPLRSGRWLKRRPGGGSGSWRAGGRAAAGLRALAAATVIIRARSGLRAAPEKVQRVDGTGAVRPASRDACFEEPNHVKFLGEPTALVDARGRGPREHSLEGRWLPLLGAGRFARGALDLFGKRRFDPAAENVPGRWFGRGKRRRAGRLPSIAGNPDSTSPLTL